MLSDIANYYRGKSVFVTGATGFIGKVLVEKLLRSCPGIANIFILMRPKKQNDVTTRFTELLNTPIFDWIRKKHPESLDKVVPVAGDVTSPGLGISQSDRKFLKDTVYIVFHLAATVKFDEPLKVAVNMNIIGTKRLVELCQEMRHLEALIHVSTAYSNCDKYDVGELIYPPPADPDLILKCVECMDEELIQIITPQLIKKHPNTYTFTKALAEHVFVRESSGIPSAIVRPSIVTAAWNEPVTGWVDSLNGATGILVGMGKGLLRTLLCDRNLIGDIIPVDIVVNFLITVGWNTAVTKKSNVTVYNCTSSVLNPVRWGIFETQGQMAFTTEPFNGVVWYPGTHFLKSRLLNNVYKTVFHIIPAHIIDTASRMANRKPMMVRLYRKIHKSVSMVEYFTTHEWKFHSTNVTGLYSKLNDHDKGLFNFNVEEVDWTKYVHNYISGIRLYTLKNDRSSADRAKARLRMMYIIHKLIQILSLSLLVRFILPKMHVSLLYYTLHHRKKLL